MTGIERTLRHILYLTVALLIIFCTGGCIKEDLSRCQTELLLQVTVVNANGDDITSTGEAGEIEVYLFDGNQLFVSRITASAEEVEHFTPITITYNVSSNFWVVVWSNLNGGQQVSPLVSGVTTMDEALVQLMRDEEEYARNPDDLFFGIKNIGSEAITRAAGDNSIMIARKTALMNISVKGLDPLLADQYYLVISGAKEDAYNFKGILTGNPIEYRQSGRFDDSGELFVSDEPFRIFPLSLGNRLTISIYAGDELITSVDTKSDGSSIIPIVGRTNNILIDLTEQAATLTVNVEVTDWNNIYHWFEW